MKIGLIEVLGMEEVLNTLEDEFEKEVETIKIKRELVPTIEDSGLAAKRLAKQDCDLIVLGYALENDEKLSSSFQDSILRAQYDLEKNIFRIIIPSDQEVKPFARDAAKEIIRFFYSPNKLEDRASKMRTGSETEEEKEEPSVFNMFS